MIYHETGIGQRGAKKDEEPLGGVSPTEVDAHPCSVPADQLSHAEAEANIRATAPHYCSKNHPLVDVAWEGQWRRGTCECGRVLAWSGKGRE